MKAPAYCILALLPVACTEPDHAALCEDFHAALNEVPHSALVVSTDEFVGALDGETYQGCELMFETADSIRGEANLPNFDATEGSEMHRLGWRMTEGIGADGPGSGIYGIENETVFCVVKWEQPSHVDDEGAIVRAEEFSMTVQCRGHS